MCQNFLYNAIFHAFLKLVDQELAKNIQGQGCPYCGSKLDKADYPRIPFSVPVPFRDHYEKRCSFCCRECRKRTTSPSVRFFGRRRFPAPLFIFISILNSGANQRRRAQVKRHFGIVVSQSTWKRWRRWWRESFMTTSFWQQSEGLMQPTPEIMQGPFPRVILNLFQGEIKEKMCTLLQFLAPMTAGALRAV